MRQNKQLRVFVRQMFNALVALGIAYATDSGMETALLIPVLNIVTKRINTTYFNDLGVE